jgi:hypothetical protein
MEQAEFNEAFRKRTKEVAIRITNVCQASQNG